MCGMCKNIVTSFGPAFDDLRENAKRDRADISSRYSSFIYAYVVPVYTRPATRVHVKLQSALYKYNVFFV